MRLASSGPAAANRPRSGSCAPGSEHNPRSNPSSSLFVRELLQADDERIGARRPGAQLLQGVFRDLLRLALRIPGGGDSARPILRVALRLPAVFVERRA